MNTKGNYKGIFYIIQNLIYCQATKVLSTGSSCHMQLCTLDKERDCQSTNVSDVLVLTAFSDFLQTSPLLSPPFV